MNHKIKSFILSVSTADDINVSTCKEENKCKPLNYLQKLTEENIFIDENGNGL